MPATGVPNVSARAGTTTSANSNGASSGISSSRGVRALIARRRRARVATAARPPVLDRARAAVGVSRVMVPVTAVMGSPWLRSMGGRRASAPPRADARGGSGGEPLPRELEVDVVEGGWAAGDGGDAQAHVGDRRDRLACRAVVDGQVQGGADGEGIVVGEAPSAERRDHPGHVAVDTQFDELAPHAG